MKINAKKTAAFIALAVGLALLPLVCNSYLDWQLKMQAREIIGNVETYMATTGEAPVDLSILGYEANIITPSGPFYNRVSMTHYQIFYRSGDNSYLTYDSHMGEWSDIPPTPPKEKQQMPPLQ